MWYLRIYINYFHMIVQQHTGLSMTLLLCRPPASPPRKSKLSKSLCSYWLTSYSTTSSILDSFAQVTLFERKFSSPFLASGELDGDGFFAAGIVSATLSLSLSLSLFQFLCIIYVYMMCSLFLALSFFSPCWDGSTTRKISREKIMFSVMLFWTSSFWLVNLAGWFTFSSHEKKRWSLARLSIRGKRKDWSRRIKSYISACFCVRPRVSFFVMTGRGAKLQKGSPRKTKKISTEVTRRVTQH